MHDFSNSSPQNSDRNHSVSSLPSLDRATILARAEEASFRVIVEASPFSTTEDKQEAERLLVNFFNEVIESSQK